MTGAARRAVRWRTLRGSPPGNRALPDTCKLSGGEFSGPIAAHLALKSTREGRGGIGVFELEAKTDLSSREKGDLEQPRLSPVAIEPGSHLGHQRPQLAAGAADLDNVHADTPGP